MTLEETILASTSAEKIRLDNAQNRLRCLSLGVTPLPEGDPRVGGACCDECGIPEEETDGGKLLQCKACKMAAYCSASCQKAHWKASHKLTCSKLNDEAKSLGEQIVREMNDGRIHNIRKALQLNDAAYAVAKKKHGLFAAMEKLFQMEADGKSPERTFEHMERGCYSWTQEIISNVFKGKREVVDRFTCACPIRCKEYLQSSPTAWDSLMDAMLHLARVLTKDDFLTTRTRQETGLSHRAARDAFVTINLALVHEKVAKAIFCRKDMTKEEAREYALNTMAPKLQRFYRNGGEGFASSDIDHNMTIQGNIGQFTAMLSYWYRTLEVDPKNPNGFIEAMKLDPTQEMTYEVHTRPLGEGMIRLGRTLTMDELRVLSLEALTEYKERKKTAKRGGKKGKKNRNRR
ncbi:hypothetical protein ACHAWF_008943 [Thalassiosira exigua]